MDALFSLIDERVQKGIKSTSFVKSVPAKVIDLLENGLIQVELISNGSIYDVPNWSGSPVGINDIVQLHFKSNVLSAQTAYIGAAPFRAGTSYVMATVHTGDLSSSEKKIADMKVVVYHPNVLVVLNAMCENNNNSEYTGRVALYIDGTLQTYRPQFTITANGTYHMSFMLPYQLSLGEHEIKITATGTGVTITNVIAYAYGYVNDKLSDFDPTDENDYVWGTNATGAEVYMYKGNSLNPEVIDELDGNAVNTLTCTSFNYSNIRSAYIPDGVTKIE